MSCRYDSASQQECRRHSRKFRKEEPRSRGLMGKRRNPEFSIGLLLFCFIENEQKEQGIKRWRQIILEQIFMITGTTLTITLPAEIDHHSSEQIRKETDRLVQKRNIRCILFDFSNAVFMDSSGIGMLIGRYKLMRFLGGTIAAIHVGERMQRILMMSGVSRLIDISDVR